MDHNQHRASAKASSDADVVAWPDVTAALGCLPLPSLVLASDGAALDANDAWAAFSAASPEAMRGDGWLSVVDPLDRDRLRARLREAAAAGQAGSCDVRLTGRAGGRWSRWWWRSGPARRLLVSVADIDEHQPRDAHAWSHDHGSLARLVRRADFVTMSWRALRRGRWDGANVAVVAVSVGARGEAGLPDDGGAVRQAVAKRILDAAGPPSVAARVGPDEFVVLCSDLRSPREAMVAASRIRDALAEPLDVVGVRVPIAASTGYALATSSGETAEGLVERAFLAVRPQRPEQSAESAAVQAGAGIDLAATVHRLAGVGLSLQYAAAQAHAPAAERLQQAVDEAVDELDAIIREVRTMAFRFRYPEDPPD